MINLLYNIIRQKSIILNKKLKPFMRLISFFLILGEKKLVRGANKVCEHNTLILRAFH